MSSCFVQTGFFGRAVFVAWPDLPAVAADGVFPPEMKNTIFTTSSLTQHDNLIASWWKCFRLGPAAVHHSHWLCIHYAYAWPTSRWCLLAPSSYCSRPYRALTNPSSRSLSARCSNARSPPPSLLPRSISLRERRVQQKIILQDAYSIGTRHRLCWYSASRRSSSCWRLSRGGLLFGRHVAVTSLWATPIAKRCGMPSSSSRVYLES